MLKEYSHQTYIFYYSDPFYRTHTIIDRHVLAQSPFDRKNLNTAFEWFLFGQMEIGKLHVWFMVETLFLTVSFVGSLVHLFKFIDKIDGLLALPYFMGRSAEQIKFSTKFT